MADFKLHNRSFLKGVEIGRLMKKPEPKVIVGYLYNGELLPALPDTELDQGTNPCKIILWNLVFRTYMYFVCNSPGVVTKVENGSQKISPAEVCLHSLHMLTDGEWRYQGTSHNGYSYPASSALWANHDVLNEDGTIYLAASEPVPVYRNTKE